MLSSFQALVNQVCDHYEGSEDVNCPGFVLLAREIKRKVRFDTVYIAWTNTDCTEGRGSQIPYVVCESLETAARLGFRKSVMGSDCPVTKSVTIRTGSLAFAPHYVHAETSEDMTNRKKREAREAILEKAKQLGLSEEEVKILEG